MFFVILGVVAALAAAVIALDLRASAKLRDQLANGQPYQKGVDIHMDRATNESIIIAKATEIRTMTSGGL